MSAIDLKAKHKAERLELQAKQFKEWEVLNAAQAKEIFEQKRARMVEKVRDLKREKKEVPYYTSLIKRLGEKEALRIWTEAV